ncbi:hypothetical protein [Aestuariivirga sp.]|uniref:hypothetical protein n=1 Tax=Aestuariivirga sp. TaxID=2650926 RepID=UPI003593F98F
MKRSLALLIASTALTAVLGTFAWSAMPGVAGGVGSPVAAVFDDTPDAALLLLASDDDDDDHGDDDDDDDDDDDECDDGNCGRGSARNPAPAGTVAPPENGLFGNGAPPQVQVN